MRVPFLFYICGMKITKTYITTNSWFKGIKNGEFIQPFIPKGSGIAVILEKNGNVKFYHQGHSSCTMDIETFNKIPKVEINFTDEFISNYIVPNENVQKLKKLFTKLRKEYKNNSLMFKVLRTLDTWIFQTKGSSSISGSQYEKLNLNDLPWVTDNGFSAKPFDFHENRSGRTTVSPTKSEIELWDNNPYEVLPIGIKIEEHCTYSEIYKIGEKLFQQVCGIEGIDDIFKNIVISFFPKIDKNYEHYDYMTGERITLNVFEKNTHHGKIKGLELCHLNPSLTFATTVNNITIGFSESNRKQSGNSIESMGLNGVNGILITMGKTPIKMEKLQTLLESI